MKAEYFSKDTLDFIVLLAKHEVRYLIVGGEAVIYYGYARLTGDIDFYYDLASDNVNKLFHTLLEFWNGSIPGITDKSELSEEGTIIQFGIPPNRIDLINRIDGLDFPDAWRNRVEDPLVWEGQKYTIYFIGLEDLIKNKSAARRNKDLDDLDYLCQLNNP